MPRCKNDAMPSHISDRSSRKLRHRFLICDISRLTRD
jgi:hypothetical protein